MNHDSAEEMVVCATCGAVVESSAARCWLCECPLGSAATARRGPSPSSAAPPIDLGAIETSAWITNIAIVIVVLVVGLGLTLQAPGLAVLYAVLALPALTAMFVVALKRRRQGRAQGPLAKVGTLFVGAAVALFGIGALSVAAVVALFVFCFYLMTTGQF